MGWAAECAAQCNTDQLRQRACGLDDAITGEAVAEAQVTLAAQYMYGECVSADFNAASRWIRYAQANGHRDAHRLSAIWHRLWTMPSPGKAQNVELGAKAATAPSTTSDAHEPLRAFAANKTVTPTTAGSFGLTGHPTADDPLCPGPAQHIRAVAYSPPDRYPIRLTSNHCPTDSVDAFIRSLHEAGLQVTRQNDELTLHTGPMTAAGKHVLECSTYRVADVEVACPLPPAREIERLSPNDANARFPGAIAVWTVTASSVPIALDLMRVHGGVDPANFAVAWWPPYVVLQRRSGNETGAIGVIIAAAPVAAGDGAQRCELARIQADVPKPRVVRRQPAPAVCTSTPSLACTECDAATVPVPFARGSNACH